MKTHEELRDLGFFLTFFRCMHVLPTPKLPVVVISPRHLPEVRGIAGLSLNAICETKFERWRWVFIFSFPKRNPPSHLARLIIPIPCKKASKKRHYSGYSHFKDHAKFSLTSSHTSFVVERWSLDSLDVRLVVFADYPPGVC